MKKFVNYLTPALVATMPALVFAQGTLQSIIQDFEGMFRSLITLLILVAVAAFIWGLISYLLAGPDEDKAAAARKYMLYGIVALAVIVAMWGLADVLLQTFGIGKGSIPTLPGN